jgi:hypothetical protein
LSKHESVCGGNRKRCPFDSQEQRLSGTDAGRFFHGYGIGRIRPIPSFRDVHRQLMKEMRAARRMERDGKRATGRDVAVRARTVKAKRGRNFRTGLRDLQS